MQQILVYSDSLSWGIIPDTRQRLTFDKRWPGVVENFLLDQNLSVRVLEDCLNGRRTAFDDPYKPGRNGLQHIQQRMEIHAPLSLLIFMLGTNDFQSMHPHNAWHASQGMASLVNAARSAPIEPGMPIPDILVISPPLLKTAKNNMTEKFAGGDKKCIGLSEAYEAVAKNLNCHFFDAASVTESSKVDGVHLDEDQHLTLGLAIAKHSQKILKT